MATVRPAAVFLCLSASLLNAHLDEESRLALLSRVVPRLQQTTARLLNYTCVETITRTVSDGTPPRLETQERLRLQVAVIGGEEHFSWPGQAPFDRTNPALIVPGGLTSSGEFANFLRAVFDSEVPSFTSGGEETYQGSNTIRYEFRIPRARSGYVLQTGAAKALVDYHGAFWIDTASEQLLALEAQVDERHNTIPDSLDIYEAKTHIRFQPFPFPGTSELTVKHRRTSIVTSNRTEFSGCRQYTADSALRFETHAPSPPAPTRPQAMPSSIPNGLKFEVTLDSPISRASSAVGDALTATLSHAVTAAGLLIPKGTRLHGRILRFEIDVQRNSTAIWFDFDRLELDGASIPFRAHLDKSDRIPGLFAGAKPLSRWFTFRDLQSSGATEGRRPAAFTLVSSRPEIPAGFHMQWVTLR